MATLDERTESDVDEDAEVKEPEAEAEGGEGADGESSTPEQTQEETETEESDDSTSAGSEEVPQNDTETERLDALKKEQEKLLADIRELRGERRDLRQKKDEPLFTEAKEDLKDVAPDDVALVEKVLRAKGYVQKSELETLTFKQQMDRHKDEWLDAHPEYKPENDPNDEKWNSLNGAITSYFKAPSHPKDVKKILDLAHKMVAPEEKKELPVRSRAETDVAKKKLTVSSKGDGGSGAKAPVTKPHANVDREHLHGFTDEEIDELFG